MNQKYFLQTTFFLLLFISIILPIKAQSDDCGFEFTEEAQNYYDSIKEQIKEL